jgi:branched-subunit amino acid ABC-type transport system permease component
VYTIELFDVITTAGVLYIVALGLLIVYGVLKIINLAHGAFLALGSYAAVIATWLGWNPWTALVIALAVGIAVGAVAEWRVLRGLYVRPLDTILATWGLNIIIVQGITLYFGREIQFAESAITGAVNVGGVTYSLYRLVLLVVAIVLGVLLWLVMSRTQIGIVARAVIMNEELAQALGINTRLVRFVTFCLGAGLAALAGALITPLVSIHPNLGVPWLINAFMLVLVAGVSLGNLALAALVLGGAQVLVSAYGNPVLGSLTIVILAVIILRFRTITT